MIARATFSSEQLTKVLAFADWGAAWSHKACGLSLATLFLKYDRGWHISDASSLATRFSSLPEADVAAAEVETLRLLSEVCLFPFAHALGDQGQARGC